MKIKKHTITHAIKYIFLSLLLALPFIAMLPSTFYYAFNQNAQDNTANEVNITYQYQTNEVNTIDDLVEGNIYKLNTVETYISTDNSNYYFEIWNDKGDSYIIDISYIGIDFNMFINGAYIDTLDSNYMSLGNGTNYNYINLQIDSNIVLNQYEIAYIEIYDYVYIINNNNFLAEFFNYMVNNQVEGGSLKINEIFLKSDFLGIEKVEIIDHDLNNQNAFYYASSQVFEKPLFNWVKNSIFVVPIMGMLGIFGISEMNFISSLLVYWVNIISIYAILNIILLVVEKLGSFGKRKNE